MFSAIRTSHIWEWNGQIWEKKKMKITLSNWHWWRWRIMLIYERPICLCLYVRRDVQNSAAPCIPASFQLLFFNWIGCQVFFVLFCPLCLIYDFVNVITEWSYLDTCLPFYCQQWITNQSYAYHIYEAWSWPLLLLKTVIFHTLKTWSFL